MATMTQLAGIHFAAVFFTASSVIFSSVLRMSENLDEVALGLDGVLFDFWRDDDIVQLGVVNACITALKVGREVFADEAIEQGSQHVLLEVPTVHSTSDIVGDLPDAAL